MSDSLTRRTGELAAVRNLATMSDEDRKRYAAQAVAERDHDKLWHITQAFLQLNGSSANTIRTYRTGIYHLLEAWQDTDLLRPTRNDGQLYVFNLRQADRPADPNDKHAIAKQKTARTPEDSKQAAHKPLSPASIRTRVSAANALYRALRWTGVTTADPFREVNLPKLESTAKQRVKEKAFSDEELNALVNYAISENDKHLLLILYLGAHGGLRADEMINLKWEHVDTMNRRLYVHGKGGRNRTVRMSKNLTATLEDRRNTDKPSKHDHVIKDRHQSLIYRKLQNAWYPAIAKQLGSNDPQEIPDMPRFEGKGIHGMRHYTGVRLAKESRNLQVVRDHLGHATVRTTEVYAGVADEANEVDDW